jgi:CDP-glucose 4,6-dehydratase
MGFWRDRPTFVTGATGLVGGWLVRRLAGMGARVVCLVRDWVPDSLLLQADATERVVLVRGDVCEQPLLERTLGEYEIATVVHLAAQTIVGVANRNPIGTFESNIRGSWCLLEACRRTPGIGQVVVASSDKAYGPQADLPYLEHAALRGTHPYDVSKSCVDLLAQAYARTYDLPVVITRCGNFYGGGDLNWNRLVPGTIRAICRGQRPVIRSNGRLVRDYFYVEDGAEAYLMLAERLAADATLRGEAFNFSNETPLAVLDLVLMIGRLMGSDLTPDIRNEATNEIAAQHLDATKARHRLGWQARFSLDEGIRRTIAWYQAFLSEQGEDPR